MKTPLKLLRDAMVPLTGAPTDFDALLERAKGCSVVLLGEASHGTHEFYRVRAEITKRLIREHGFCAVAVEADWPDAYRINKYVRGLGNDGETVDALGGFRRFPQWMWRNTDVLDFIGWLRSHNESVMDHNRKGTAIREREVGFYGLDLYSLNASMSAVIDYLRHKDPETAALVAERYACFDLFGGDTHRYGLLTGSGAKESCEEEVLEALLTLHHGRGVYVGHDGREAADEFFNAEQNARLIRDAEKYYRTMFQSDVSSWNLRDRHMMMTLLMLIQHLKHTYGSNDALDWEPKIVVWAHNSHLGNAAATSMGARGEFNVGQLVKEYFGDAALLVGFTTHHGTVTASSDWDGAAERKRVRPALEESYEALFHETGEPRFWLDCHANSEISSLLEQPRLERAIGVIYRPHTERQSHYFTSSLPRQFDAIFHYDETRAVEPLERTTEWTAGELDETYPSGL
jgi:erythromycin esterase-like protein